MTQVEKANKRKAVENDRKELLSLLLKKANLKYKDLVDASIDTWIATNLDLLTDSDKRRFKNLVL